MVTAVVAAFLYLRIMVTMWVSSPDDGADVLPVPFSAGVAIAAAVAFTLVVGIVPGWLIDAADTVTAYAR
jgi:NADH-quinone oxidoreductase subunit N